MEESAFTRPMLTTAPSSLPRLLDPMTPFGKKFTFEPQTGHLSGGEIQIIRVRLLSDLLGAFSETFEWSIKGSSIPLHLQLKGHVAGPSFEVDVDALDFGVVSYGFRWARWGNKGENALGVEDYSP